METISFSLVMFLNQDSPIVKSLSPGGTESPPFHISTVWGGLLRRLLPTCPGGAGGGASVCGAFAWKDSEVAEANVFPIRR